MSEKIRCARILTEKESKAKEAVEKLKNGE